MAKLDAAFHMSPMMLAVAAPGMDGGPPAGDLTHARTVDVVPVNSGPASIEGRVPGRLNEALHHALAGIEADAHAVAAIMAHLGWDGRDCKSDDALGEATDLDRAQVERLADRAIGRLRDAGFVPEAVRRSIAVAEQSLPLLEAELCEVLLKAKLCYVRFSCDALVSAAEVFSPPPPFELVRFGPRDGLVKSGTANGVEHLVAAAQRLTRIRGCANIAALADRAQAIFGPNTSCRFTEAVIRTGAGFEWLDQAGGWFWYMPNRGRGSNRLVSQIRRVMAIAPRLSLRELRAAIRRDYRLGSFAPPLNVLAAVCKRLFFVRLDGDGVIRLPSLLPRDEVFSADEAAVIDIFSQAAVPVLSRAELVARCHERGLDEITTDQFMSRSAILKMPAPDVYALVGTAAPAEDAAAVSGSPVSTSAGHGFLPDERVFLARKIDSSMLLSGVLRVPDPVSILVEGDYRLKAIAGDALGVLQVRQLACWDIRPLLRHAGGELDDTLIIVFDPPSGEAVGVIGDGNAIGRVMSGDHELLMTAGEEDQGEERERSSAAPSTIDSRDRIIL